MNPLKALKDVVPKLAEVLESIHAHLEQILEENRVQTKLLIKLNETKAQESSIRKPEDTDNHP